MIRQYNAGRFGTVRLGGRPRRIGTVPVGAIIYLQDGVRPLSGPTRPPVFKSPSKPGARAISTAGHESAVT
jgi:hypothetical protein